MWSDIQSERRKGLHIVLCKKNLREASFFIHLELFLDHNRLEEE